MGRTETAKISRVRHPAPEEQALLVIQYKRGDHTLMFLMLILEPLKEEAPQDPPQASGAAVRTIS